MKKNITKTFKEDIKITPTENKVVSREFDVYKPKKYKFEEFKQLWKNGNNSL